MVQEIGTAIVMFLLGSVLTYFSTPQGLRKDFVRTSYEQTKNLYGF